jgi:Na+/H+ antiporter NhaD/arsenite permease-like protein
MNLPLWTLATVLLFIAFRRSLRLAIWQIMLGGAAFVVSSRAISLVDAWHAIDWEIIGFLFGMFVLGQALVSSGLLNRLSGILFGRIDNAEMLVLAVLSVSGAASTLLMNDTLAVIGTPLMLTLARTHRRPPLLLLLALAFGVTIGSAASPVGNPQKLLIAMHGGIENPFLLFSNFLALPTALNLLFAWVVLRIAFRRGFHGQVLTHPIAPLEDPALARHAAMGLAVMAALVLIKTGLATFFSYGLPLWILAAGACSPVLLLSPKKYTILREIDWRTLVFFAAMFVLMRSVWDSGAIRSWLPESVSGVPGILFGAALLSQLISNVPLVALLLPTVHSGGQQAMLALAAGSTVGGNLTLMGAASNVIIAQLAERQGIHLDFWGFLAVGAPLTLVNLLVYWFFL